MTASTAELKLRLISAGTKLVFLQPFRGQFQVTPLLTSAEKPRASVAKTRKSVSLVGLGDSFIERAAVDFLV